MTSDMDLGLSTVVLPQSILGRWRVESVPFVSKLVGREMAKGRGRGRDQLYEERQPEFCISGAFAIVALCVVFCRRPLIVLLGLGLRRVVRIGSKRFTQNSLGRTCPLLLRKFLAWC